MSDEQLRCTDDEIRAYACQNSQFGRRYEGACLSKINFDEESSNKLNSFLNKPKNFLIYLGNPGIGKTYFCAALIPWAIRKKLSFRCWHEDRIFQSLREKISSENGDYLQHLKLMIDDTVIIIDDLGCNKRNDWREEIIFDLIDVRYNSTRPTIFTSNLTKQDFKNIYHPRIYSRLFAAENILVEAALPDLRQEGM